MSEHRHPDLAGIAREADVEIAAAESLRLIDTDAVTGVATAELGYYEAELISLRDAASATDEAERR
jgi:hypothetical protein